MVLGVLWVAGIYDANGYQPLFSLSCTDCIFRSLLRRSLVAIENPGLKTAAAVPVEIAFRLPRQCIPRTGSSKGSSSSHHVFYRTCILPRNTSTPPAFCANYPSVRSRCRQLKYHRLSTIAGIRFGVPLLKDLLMETRSPRAGTWSFCTQTLPRQ